MADVITRFKLETTQYDSKLRDAAKSLKEYVHQAELGGKGFNQFSQKSIEAARSLGTVASGATTLKDKVKDLVGAYNEAAKAYNNLTKEQQQSDFGKALSESIGQLSDRIKEAKTELYSLGDAVKGKSGGLFGDDKLGGMLQVFGGNLMTKVAGMASSLVSEIGSAINQSIELSKSAEGVRLAFERLNRPDLLDKLKNATHGTVSELELMKQAVKFNDFKLNLDEMGVLLAFAQQKAKDTGQSVDYMVDSIVTGLGRQSLQILDNLGLSAAQIKEKMKDSGDMTKAVAEIIKEQMAEAGEYVETAADRAAKATADLNNAMVDLGDTISPFKQRFDEWWNSAITGAVKFLDKSVEVLDELKDINQQTLDEGIASSSSRAVTELKMLWDVADTLWRKIRGEDNEAGAGAVVGTAIGRAAAAAAEDQTSQPPPKRKPKGGGRSGKTQAEIDAENFAKIQNGLIKAMAKSGLGADSLKGADIPKAMSGWASMTDEAKNKFLDMNGVVVQLSDSLNNLTKWTPDFDPMKGILEKQQKMVKGWQAASMAIGAVGNALSGLKNPAIDIMMVIGQAVATIGLAYAQSLAKDVPSKTNIWSFIAAASAATISMVSTIASLHQATGYAQGGEIKGNSYSGDNLMAMGPSGLVGLNAGEIVLNKAQQANVAQGLQNGGLSGISLQAVASGEQLWFVMNNHTKRKGWGEIVTWR